MNFSHISTNPSHLVWVLCWSPPPDYFHFVSFSTRLLVDAVPMALGTLPVLRQKLPGWSKSRNNCWDQALKLYPDGNDESAENYEGISWMCFLFGMILVPIFKVHSKLFTKTLKKAIVPHQTSVYDVYVRNTIYLVPK